MSLGIVHENYVSSSIEMYSVLNTYAYICFSHVENIPPLRNTNIQIAKYEKQNFDLKQKSYGDPMKRSFCEQLRN